MMENFQLYRTNLFLGGQMKWDVVIDTNSITTLKVSDFHLTPISNNITYIYKSDENLLNTSHLTNVKSHYNKIKGNFYSNGLSAEFKHNWPIICKENEVLNNYVNDYDMGCKRAKQFSKYKKQFEYFCPVWLEKISNEIKFRFLLKDIKNKNVIIASKTLSFSLIGNNYHDRFVNYFNNYIKDIHIAEGSNDLLNINFSTDEVKLHGIDVSNGMIRTKSINHLITNFKLRERPLMETDHMMINSFVKNELIAKQLFNFNFCFNLDDIFPSKSIVNYSTEKFLVDVEIYVDGKKLEKRDFYTNYDFIEKSIDNKNIITSNNESNNILNYLKDHHALELINKNKFCQSVFHWSLCDNNDYIFNLYNGFSGIYAEENFDDKGNVISYNCFENLHQYKNFPNLFTKVATSYNNATGWINSKKIQSIGEFNEYIHTDLKKKDATYVYGNIFINGVRYKNIPKLELTDSNGNVIMKGVYMLSMYMEEKIFNEIIEYSNKNNITCIKIINNMYVIRKNDLILIITTDINNLTYRSFSETMYEIKQSLLESFYLISNNDYENKEKNLEKEVKFFELIYALLERIIYPTKIEFVGGLSTIYANGPSKELKEISYIKTDKINCVFRYDGKLRPTFVSNDDVSKINFLYYKDYLSDNTNGVSKLRTSDYIKYINSGFEPNYPSLNYCAIKQIKKYNYDEIPFIKVTEYNLPIKLINAIEYSWFNINECMNLKPEISFKKESKSISLEEIVKEYISQYYNTSDLNVITYIFNKYDIENNLDYKSNTDIDNYIYNIKLTLK